jgi:protein ImuB
MRIAALWVPDFPLQALRRSTPELAEAPLAVAAGPLPRDLIVCVAAEAAELGVWVGMTAAQARQVAPAVLVRATPEAAAAAAGEALADVAGGFSPRIRRHRSGEVLLDVGGLTPRFGSEPSEPGFTPGERGGHGGSGASGWVGGVDAGPPATSEREFTSRERGGLGGSGARGGARERRGTPREEAIAGELLRACRHVGLEVRVGIAASVGVARTAAHCSELTVVRAGEERKLMAPLPLSLLEPSPDVAAMLARWGLVTAGELARLPREEVALRLGTEGVALHRLACGEETAAFVPDPLQEVLREGVEVDFPLGALEPFLFLLNGVLGRLERRLELRGEGFAEVLLELRLEGGERREVRLKLVAPTREVPAVLALARLQLEASPPGAAVEGVAALVTPGRVRLMQGSLFGPPMPAPGKLSTTLARLAVLVGPERMGAPAVPDTHRPGAWSLVPFAPLEDRVLGTERQLQDSSRGVGELCPAPGALTPVLRVFRPPREARVDAVNGRPAVVWVDTLGGIVVGWAGPYRLVGEWWGDEPFAREDFDVATTDGSLLRIHFDRLEQRWFADGVYD